MRLSHNSHLLMLWFIWLIPIVTGHAGDDAPDSKLIVYTHRDTDLYQSPDTSHRLGRIAAGSEFELIGIKGTSKWILVSNDSMCGWINPYSVVFKRSFIAGYRLRLHQWSMKPSDFEHETGLPVEWRDLTDENRRQGYIYDGLYPKNDFETYDEAKHLGDSLAQLDLLLEEAATGLYYRIIPLFKQQYPHLYFVDGFGKPLACPVCGGILFYPPLNEIKPEYLPDDGYMDEMTLANRIMADEFWIYQCKNKHLVITFNSTWD